MGMTLPSLQELKRLQTEISTGGWDYLFEPANGIAVLDIVMHGGPYGAVSAEDGELIILAPALLAEVIRLREELEAMKARHEQLALKSQDRADHSTGDDKHTHARFENHHRRVCDHITRILESGTE